MSSTIELNSDHKRASLNYDRYPTKVRKIYSQVGDGDDGKDVKTYTEEPVTPESKLKNDTFDEKSKPTVDEESQNCEKKETLTERYIDEMIDISRVVNERQKLDEFVPLYSIFMTIERYEALVEKNSRIDATVILGKGIEEVKSHIINLFQLHDKIVSQYIEFISVALNINNSAEYKLRGEEYVKSSDIEKRLWDHGIKPLFDMTKNIKNNIKKNKSKIYDEIINDGILIDFIQAIIIKLSHMMEEITEKYHLKWNMHIADLYRVLMILNATNKNNYRLNSLYCYNSSSLKTLSKTSKDYGLFFYNLAKVQTSILQRLVSLAKCICDPNTNQALMSQAQLLITNFTGNRINENNTINKNSSLTTSFQTYLRFSKHFLISKNPVDSKDWIKETLHYFKSKFATESYLYYGSKRLPEEHNVLKTELNNTLLYYKNSAFFSLINIFELTGMGDKLNPFFCLIKVNQQFDINSISLNNWKHLIGQLDGTLLQCNKLVLKRFLKLKVIISLPFFIPWCLFIASLTNNISKINENAILKVWKSLLEDAFPWVNISSYLNQLMELLEDHLSLSKRLRDLIKQFASLPFSDIMSYILFKCNLQEVDICNHCHWFDTYKNNFKELQNSKVQNLQHFKHYDNLLINGLIYDEDDQNNTKVWVRAIIVLLLFKNVAENNSNLINITLKSRLNSPSEIKDTDNITFEEFVKDWKFSHLFEENECSEDDDTAVTQIYKPSQLPELDDFKKDGEINWGHSLVTNYDSSNINYFNRENESALFKKIVQELFVIGKESIKTVKFTEQSLLSNTYFIVDTAVWVNSAAIANRIIDNKHLHLMLSPTVLEELDKINQFVLDEKVSASSSQAAILIQYLYSNNKIDMLNNFYLPTSKLAKTLVGFENMKFNYDIGDLLTNTTEENQKEKNYSSFHKDNVIIVTDDELMLIKTKEKNLRTVSTKFLFSLSTVIESIL